MKKNIDIKFFFLICLVLMFANTALLSQTWETHTNKDDVQDLCFAGDYCWAATTGGVVKVNIHDFSFETFEREEGLPSNYIKAITSNNNKIWFGSLRNGITLFDNETWTIYDSKNSGLKNNNINCLITDKKSRIWIGSCSGVFVFDGLTWLWYKEEEIGLESSIIFSINIDSEGKIWAGTNSGLSFFDGEKWQSFSTVNSELQSNLINDISFESNNIIWLATDGAGVHRYINDKWENYNKDNSGLLDNYIISTYVDSKNNKWFGSGYGRIYCYNDTTWCIYDSTNCILPFDSTFTSNPLATINAISEDKNGNMWFGTKMGLYFYNGTDWKKVTISGTLPSNNITAISVDQKNQKWYGTFKGVSVDKNGEWQTFNTLNSNIQADMINAIAADSSGNVWIATENKGAVIYDGDSLRDLKSLGYKLPMNYILSMAVDKTGNFCIGGFHGLGIYEYNGSTFINYIDPDNNPSSAIVADIGIDRYNNKWICTSTMGWSFGNAIGVGKFDGSNWQFFNPGNSGIASNDVEAVAVEDNGLIWFGTTNGVSIFDGENWQTYNSDNSGLIRNYITSITIDKKGRKWFGTYGKGLCMYDGEIWHVFTTANSKLCNNYIQALETDKNGNVLIGTFYGLSIYKDTETGITHQTETEIPDNIELLQNYPNPFNANTKIRYKLSGKGHVKIQIFNIYGQHVKTLYDREQNPGMYSTNWNGQNDYGETVSSGVYFCRLALNEQNVETIRVVFLK